MTKFNHPNVMRLLGVTISQSKSLLLIMPFMAQGSLLHYLRKYREDLNVGNEEMTISVRVFTVAILSRGVILMPLWQREPQPILLIKCSQWCINWCFVYHTKG